MQLFCFASSRPFLPPFPPPFDPCSAGPVQLSSWLSDGRSRMRSAQSAIHPFQRASRAVAIAQSHPRPERLKAKSGEISGLPNQPYSLPYMVN